MAQQVARPAGVAGVISYTLSGTPFSVPQVTIYSDPARTQIAVAATACTLVGGTTSTYTAPYPATLPPGIYYLRFATVWANGQPAQNDDSASLLLIPEVGVVS